MELPKLLYNAFFEYHENTTEEKKHRKLKLLMKKNKAKCQIHKNN